ncbi:hydrolase [Aureococcus anophagefferens]|uniref:Hydrolase n=1 Tax=Aureococcus anophagefferens TaxID=44056 RepID=A0ABR1FIT7_AURAN
MSALDASKAGAKQKGKPSPEEIARRAPPRGARKAAAPKAAAPPPPPQQKKERDPAAEAAALRDFGVGCARPSTAREPPIPPAASTRPRLLDRAALAGVGRVVLTGCDVAGSRSGVVVLRAAVRGGEKGLYATAACTRRRQDLGRRHGGGTPAIAASPHCVALGECGLDYDRMFSRARAAGRLRGAGALARDLGKPLWVHVREVDAPGAPLGAYADAIAILGASGLDQRRVVHCFTGSKRSSRPSGTSARAWASRASWASRSGPAPRGPPPRRSRRRAPRRRQRAATETDAPFMLPDKAYVPAALGKQLGLRGGKNEPAVLPAVARALADALGADARASLRRRRPPRAFFAFDAADAAVDGG